MGLAFLIRVVDDGMDTTHEDLQATYDSTTSYDYCDNDPDPNPVQASDNHGTAVSGVAAGVGKNGVGIAGVAWGASHNHARFLCGGTNPGIVRFQSGHRHLSQFLGLWRCWFCKV